jgi:hypothetical protein
MVREEGRGGSRMAPSEKGGPSGRGKNRTIIQKKGQVAMEDGESKTVVGQGKI